MLVSCCISAHEYTVPKYVKLWNKHFIHAIWTLLCGWSICTYLKAPTIVIFCAPKQTVKNRGGGGGGVRGIKIDRAMNNWANFRWLNYIWDNHSRQAVNMVGKFTTIDTVSSHCNELNIQDPSSCRLISGASCFDTQDNIKGTNRATKLYTYHQKKRTSV